ncbi:MAG: hypothetical protein ACYDCL_09635 [Myxococcales bacterium]
MRLLGLVLAAALAAGCNTHGGCCDDGDCWGNFFCSEDCSVNGGRQGVCLQRCQVDLDCGVGEVCDLMHTSCGCEAPPDGGAAGSCPQGSNNG